MAALAVGGMGDMAALTVGGRGGRRNIRKILVAGETRHIVRLVQVNLERAGNRVVCAPSAQEALEQITNEVPDFFIMYVMLPDCDGYALTRQLKNSPETASLPILLLIPGGSTEIEKALSAGADYYLVKPFAPALPTSDGTTD